LLSFPGEFETLRGILLRRGWLNIDDPVAYGTILQVSDALAHAHENDVLHLLIRPEHILIDPSGDAFLTGFGLCQNEVSEPLIGELARTAASEYISPEFRGDVPLTQQTDVYSLGVTLYEMMTDRVPRRGTPGKRGQSGGPLAPALVLETVSPAVSTLILRMLEDDPSKRFWDISDFRVALTAAIEPLRVATETAAWSVDLMPSTAQEDGADTVFAGKQSIPILVEEAAEDPAMRDRGANESETTKRFPTAIEGDDLAPLLPGLPLPPEAWQASGAGSSDSPVQARVRQPEGSLSNDDVVDVREQIIVRWAAAGTSAHQPRGLITLRQIDQGTGIPRVLLLTATLIILVSAAVLIATERWAGSRKSEGAPTIEQVRAPAAAANQAGTVDQGGGHQNDVARPERRIGDQASIGRNRAPARGSTQFTRSSVRSSFKRHRRVQGGSYTGPRVRSYWRRTGYYE